MAPGQALRREVVEGKKGGGVENPSLVRKKFYALLKGLPFTTKKRVSKIQSPLVYTLPCVRL